MGLAEDHGDRCVRGELFEHLDEHRFNEHGIHGDLAHVDGDHLVALAHCKGDALEGGGLLGGLLQPLECLAARVEFATGARDEASGFHIVDLNARFTLGREAELFLGFEPVRLSEGAQQNLAVTNGDGTLVN